MGKTRKDGKKLAPVVHQRQEGATYYLVSAVEDGERPSFWQLLISDTCFSCSIDVQILGYLNMPMVHPDGGRPLAMQCGTELNIMSAARAFSNPQLLERSHQVGVDVSQASRL